MPWYTLHIPYWNSPPFITSVIKFSLKNCSDESGHVIIGTPALTPSMVEFHPQYITYPPTAAWLWCLTIYQQPSLSIQQPFFIFQGKPIFNLFWLWKPQDHKRSLGAVPELSKASFQESHVWTCPSKVASLGNLNWLSSYAEYTCNNI